jgi:hypothetical protein
MPALIDRAHMLDWTMTPQAAGESSRTCTFGPFSSNALSDFGILQPVVPIGFEEEEEDDDEDFLDDDEDLDLGDDEEEILGDDDDEDFEDDDEIEPEEV